MRPGESPDETTRVRRNFRNGEFFALLNESLFICFQSPFGAIVPNDRRPRHQADQKQNSENDFPLEFHNLLTFFPESISLLKLALSPAVSPGDGETFAAVGCCRTSRSLPIPDACG
jgi:hypothetical protein